MALVVILAAAGSVEAQAFENLTMAERRAVEMRRLQSDMVVAALSCGMREEYNAATVKFMKEFARQGEALKRLFRRTYGRDRAERELDRFVTALANEASARSLAHNGNYCVSAGLLFKDIMGLSPKDLAGFLRHPDSRMAPSGTPVEEIASTPTK